MPKLSKLEFAELVRSMPGASPDEVLKEAQKRETVSETPQAPDDRTFVGKAADTVLPTALRILGAVGGGTAGTIAAPGVGTVLGGGAGAALGEELAQGYEQLRGLRKPGYNWKQVGAQGLIGAVPVAGEAGSVGKTMLNRGLQGAALGGASTALTDLAEGQTPTVKGVLTGAGMGGALGAGAGAVEAKALQRLNAGKAASASTTSPTLHGSTSEPVYSPLDAARKIAELHNANEGSTFNLHKGDLGGTDHFAVSIHKGREVVVPGKDVPPEAIAAFIEQNHDLLKDPENSMGTWFNKNDGKSYLDVSQTVPTLEDAIKLGQAHNQLGVFDLKNFETIPLKQHLPEGASAEVPMVKEMAGNPGPEFQTIHEGAVGAPKANKVTVPESGDQPLRVPSKNEVAEQKAKLDAFRATAAEQRGEVQVGRDGHTSDGQTPPSAPTPLEPSAGQNQELSPFLQTSIDEPMLQFEHRSKVPDLVDLQPSFYGKGQAGAESARKERFPQNWEDRIYATIKGGTIEPRIKALPHTYEGAVPEKAIYDLSTDPAKIAEGVRNAEDGLSSPERYNLIEKKVKDAGYAGYRVSQHENPAMRDTVVLFDTTPVKAVAGLAKGATALGVAAPGLMPDETFDAGLDAVGIQDPETRDAIKHGIRLLSTAGGAAMVGAAALKHIESTVTLARTLAVGRLATGKPPAYVAKLLRRTIPGITDKQILSHINYAKGKVDELLADSKNLVEDHAGKHLYDRLKQEDVPF